MTLLFIGYLIRQLHLLVHDFGNRGLVSVFVSQSILLMKPGINRFGIYFLIPSDQILQILPQLLLNSSVQLVARRHADYTAPLLPGLDLLLDLIHRFLDFLFWIIRQSQCRLPGVVLASDLRHLRLVALVQLLDEEGLAGAVEECQRGEHADDAVEVDVGPEMDRAGEGQDDERDHGERHSKLRREPAKEVVVAFVLGRLGAVRSQEEGTNMAAEI